MLRVQCNANHDDRSIDGLIDAFASLDEGDGPARPGELSAARKGPHWNGRAEHDGQTQGRKLMAGGRGTVLLIMLVAVVALAVGETALSKGMKQIDRVQGGWVDQAVAVVRNGWIAAGLVLLIAHLGLYMLALKYADLSFALPLTAAAYPLSALLARFYLHEDVSLSRAPRHAGHHARSCRRRAGRARRAIESAATGSAGSGPGGPGAARDLMNAARQLGFHQVEQIADPLHEGKLLRREPHVKLALDPHHQSDQVDRIEPEGFSEVLIVLRRRIRFTHFLFEQGHELGAKRFPV